LRARTGAALAAAAAIAAVTTALVLGDGAPRSSSGRATPASPPAASHERSGREDCATRSEARFPRAFDDARNLVVGPLVLVGGAFTPADTVREFGGNKFPLLVKAGYTVTVRIGRSARGVAGLAYGRLPQGEVELRDAYQAVTFRACRPGGPSGSDAGGVEVTFWSGFVLARRPMCVPLDVYIDSEPLPRHVGLSLGRRC
jgi:hypothetical protein